MFCLLPIIGSGTRDAPYRVDVPIGITYHSAHIPTDRNGVPRYLEAITHFDDDLIVPPNIVTRLKSGSTVRGMLEVRDSRCKIKDMKRIPQLRDAQMYLGGGSLATDNFDRADGPLGSLWDDGYAPENALAINGNRAGALTAGAGSVESYNGVALPNNQWVQCDLAAKAGAVISLVHVLTRMTAPAIKTWYAGEMAQNFSTRSRIVKNVAGIETTLASENVTTWAVGDVLRLEADGTALALYRNNSTTALLTATDSAIAGGRAGLLFYVEGAVTNYLADNWSAGPAFSPPHSRHPMSHLLIR